MKLKLRLLNRDLGIRFGINDAFVSKIFRSWILPLALLMKNVIIWPERDTVSARICLPVLRASRTVYAL